VAPSISSAIPGMPAGKPAGVRCIQLDSYNRCLLFGKPERPAVCLRIKPEPGMCGADTEQAMHTLGEWERATSPSTATTTDSILGR
jgi:hypothetical protein